MTEAIPASGPGRTIKKWLVWIIVIVSLAWTIYNWSGILEIKNQLGKLGLFAGLFLFTEICFVVGAMMMVAGLGTSLKNYGDGKRLRGLRKMRKNIRLIASQVTTNRRFRRGFNLNWFGAIGTGVVSFVGIVLVMPTTSWGLLVYPVLDIAASIGWRYPIDRKVREMKEFHEDHHS